MVEPDTLRDRAFIDGTLRLRFGRADEAERRVLEDARTKLTSAAAQAHAELRANIRNGTLRGDALRACFDAWPSDERDHYVEEVLGIAYPVLAEAAPENELVSYCPSGYDEIVHAFDATGLQADDRFIDVGSGAGKSVLLAKLLCGAMSAGIERDAPIHALASAAAAGLGVDVSLTLGDARDVAFAPADVAFMYIPFTGATLAAVLRRLLVEARPRFVCAGALDLGAYPELVATGESRSWLHVYARTPSTMRL